jgi:hypothetical protein
MTRQYENQSFDQKTGSADERVSGETPGLPGARIARGEQATGVSDAGGPEGNSPERKTARNGSDSNAS